MKLIFKHIPIKATIIYIDDSDETNRDYYNYYSYGIVQEKVIEEDSFIKDDILSYRYIVIIQ